LIFVLVCISPVFGEEAFPEARKAAQTIQKLREIGVPATPYDQRVLPPGPVPGLLRQLNEELEGLIVRVLNDQTRHAMPGEDEILEQLRAAGWDDLPSNKFNSYGEINQVKFDWKLGYSPNLLIVSTQLWLPCGAKDPDTTIYVFEGGARQFKLVLATDSDFEPTLGEQDEGMQYRISPPDDRGKWFLVVAHEPPKSCGWQEAVLRYKALRPGNDPHKPEVILAEREVLGNGPDISYQLSVAEDWFEITERKPRKFDKAPGNVILRYDVNGKRAQRVAPLAETAEDFLDQWAQLPWEEARRWAKEGASLEGLHSKLNRMAADSAEIESVHRCSGDGEDGSVWVMKLWMDRHGNEMNHDETRYIEISLNDGIYRVEAEYGSPPKSCAGEYLPYRAEAE
jgi:hypothetical protein